MICTKCGKNVIDGVNFCDSCGAPVSGADTTQTQVQNTVTPNEAQENKVVNILAYLGILFFLPLVSTPNSKSGRFHANQGLVLLLTGIAGQIILSILGSILWRLWLLISLISMVWGFVLLAFMILGMVNASKGEQKQLPVIGGVRIIK